MSNINLEIIKYLTNNTIVSQNKLEKQLYLVDWFSCLINENQLSSFDWKSDNGPKAKGLNKLIHDNDDILKIIEKNNIKSIHFENYLNNFQEKDSKIINFVLEKTKDLNISELTDYVFSSYPFQASHRNYDLNLKELSLEYLEEKNKDINVFDLDR